MKPITLLYGCLCLLLPACAWQAAEAPPMPAPANWAQADTASDAWPESRWWDALGSAELSALVTEAVRSNPDMAATSARLAQAEARLRSARASLWPSINVSLAGRRSDTLNNGIDTVHAYGATVGASYEIDFWGGQKAGRDAARASRDASIHDQETARLTLVASVATTYLQLLSLQDQLAIARQNLANAERFLQLIDARFRAGAVSRLDLSQQQAQVFSQRAAIPPLQQQVRASAAALALLLGRLPQDFAVATHTLAGIQALPVRAGLPSGLLERRPDVRRAKAQWQAAEAGRRVAQADRFPRLGLTAEAGLQSSALRDLLDGDPAWTAVLGMTQPVFAGGRLAAAEQEARAREQEQLAAWRAVVLTAFADVDVALGNVHALVEQREWQRAQLDEAQTTVRLAEVRYREGQVDLLTVLDAQRSLYGAQSQSVQLQQAHLQSLVTLYRALGGGW